MMRPQGSATKEPAQLFEVGRVTCGAETSNADLTVMEIQDLSVTEARYYLGIFVTSSKGSPVQR